MCVVKSVSMVWTMISGIAAVVALVFSAVSLYFSHRSLTWEKQASEAATRSADAAEEANRLLRQQIEEGTFGHPASARAADIQLELQHVNKARWVLRNTGTQEVTGLKVTGVPDGVLHRNIPKNISLRPGEGRDIILQGTMGSPLPNQLWATYDGLDEPVALALSS